MECTVCGDDVWVGSSTGTCPECLRVIIAHSVPEDEEPTEPMDEDLVTKDYVTFYRAGMGKVAFVVPPTADDWREHAKAYMERTEYWPDVWYEEERGGYTNITMEGP